METKLIDGHTQLIMGRWYEKYEIYRSISGVMWRANDTSRQVPPRVVDKRLLDTQSKLKVLFMYSTKPWFVIVSTLKSPHNNIGISVSTFKNGEMYCRLGINGFNAWYSREPMSWSAVLPQAFVSFAGYIHPFAVYAFGRLMPCWLCIVSRDLKCWLLQ